MSLGIRTLQAVWAVSLMAGCIASVASPAAAEKMSTGDAKTDAVMVALQKRLKKVETCRARMVIQLRIMDQQLEIRGDALFKAPDLMRLDLTLPGDVRQTVVSDGALLWTYNADEEIVARVNRVRVYRESGREADADQPDPTRPFRGLQWKTIRYAGNESVDGKNLRIFDAVPELNPTYAQLPSAPARVRVYVDPQDGLTRLVKIYDASDAEIITQQFTGLEVNPDLEDARFEFVVPAGAHVIDMTDDIIELLKPKTEED